MNTQDTGSDSIAFSIPRHSRVLDKLRRGEFVYSMKFNLESSRAVEIAGITGFDCAWVCDEHIADDPSTLERQILAAKSYGMDLLVRVRRGSYNGYIKPLELDAAGIMVPHVISAADAAEVVRCTRFHPIGRRAVDGGNADGMFCLFPQELDYYQFVNRNRFLLIQIEDVEAMAELDAICATEGIDIIFFGPGDFSHSLGVPGQLDHPEVVEARRRVAACARKHGKFAGTVGSAESAAELHALGYQFLNVGADVRALGEYFQSIRRRLENI